ncbi:hypothetical protein [Nonomuraea sp. NPDC049684]|uniref:hypothetical protein n=1 Tax=unclassified Nonomuraea TaxID=2593643 RepID=UPI00379ACFB1
MRRGITALALAAVTALAPVLASTPAEATSTLQVVYTGLPYDICVSFGQSGQQNGRWQTWWCSTHYPQSYPGSTTYDLWAYVD